ncbi:hypothetical protein WA026_003275 [Henosepilachna vigintioctopunctata]|uniref:Uncharacterized protein n=1 Tax=Henosepilachna vigintioctopunctata TaxID=420089 RepID=A0AAW1TP47_9CUCU
MRKMFSMYVIIFDLIFFCTLSSDIYGDDTTPETFVATAPRLICYDTDKFNPDQPEGEKQCEYGDSCVRYRVRRKDYQIMHDSLKCGTKAACEAKGKEEKSKNPDIDMFTCLACEKHFCVPNGSLLVETFPVLTILSPLSILYLFSLK